MATDVQDVLGSSVKRVEDLGAQRHQITEGRAPR